MRISTQAEVDERRERVAHLYQSQWLVDNITAILMSTDVGSHGLDEGIARAKADAIIKWMHFKDTLLPEGEELNRNDQTGGQGPSTESPAKDTVTAKEGEAAQKEK